MFVAGKSILLGIGQATMFSESQKRCISMATKLEFFIEYAA